MPFKLFKTVVRLPYRNGVNRDCSENTFWWHVNDDDLGGALGYVGDQLRQFYGPTGDSTDASWARWIANYVDRDACTLTYSEVDEATNHQVGEANIQSFPIAPAVSVVAPLDYPAEVALCLSYKSVGGGSSPVPARRKRGRVYLGPFAFGVETGGGGSAISTPDHADLPGYPDPSLALRQAVLDAATLLGVPSVSPDVNWVVWSRPNADGKPTPYDGSLHDIDTLWVDNEWDTQRRRGVRASTRITSPTG